MKKIIKNHVRLSYMPLNLWKVQVGYITVSALTLSLPSPWKKQYLSAKHVLQIYLLFIYFIAYL